MLTLEQQNYAYNAYLETMKYLNKPKSLLQPNFGSNSAMYVFTTENLVDYIKKVNPAGKAILTNTGSGDQLINLALMGASRIDNFDVNQNASFITKLKIAALQTLNYDEFLNFFCLYENEKNSTVYHQQKLEENNKVFSFKSYLQIKPYLDETSAFFWNLIYEDFQFDGKKLASSNLFFYSAKASALANNAYLKDEESYLEARKRIDDVQVNYIECNYLDVHNLSDVYDIILFSNVYSNLIAGYEMIMSEEEFVKYIEEKASTRLTEEGIIAVVYRPDYSIKKCANKGLIKRILGKGYILDRGLSLEEMNKILISSFFKKQEEVNKCCLYLYERREN